MTETPRLRQSSDSVAAMLEELRAEFQREALARYHADEDGSDWQEAHRRVEALVAALRWPGVASEPLGALTREELIAKIHTASVFYRTKTQEIAGLRAELADAKRDADGWCARAMRAESRLKEIQDA